MINRRSRVVTPGRVLLVCIAAALSQASSGEATVDPRALAILDAARVASGGERWAQLHGVRYRAEVSSNGSRGSAETIEDTMNGRYADHYVMGAVKGGQGYDGSTPWALNLSDELVHAVTAEERRATVNEAYRRSLAYWFRERHAATIALADPQIDGPRRFDVVRITPAGGRPFEFCIDQQTHQIARIVEQADGDTLTTDLYEYRAVDGLMFPFRTRTSNGVEKFDTAVHFTSIELDPPLSAAMFAAGSAPSERFGLTSDYGRTTLPMTLLNEHAYVDVKLNERGPFRFLLDSGGQNLISHALAEQLGLAASRAPPARGTGKHPGNLGLAKIGRVLLGEAYVDDQEFKIFDAAAFSRAEGFAVNGVIGFEVIRNFVTRIDYAAGELTLYDNKRFRYVGAGRAVPFEFRESLPLVHGELDGVAAEFALDTGSGAGLLLPAALVVRHGLVKRYASQVHGIVGWDVAGARRGYLARGTLLTLGGVGVDAPVVALATPQDESSSHRASSNAVVGTGVLEQFNVVFDWGNKQVFLEPHAGSGQRPRGDRSGLWLRAGEGGFEVVDVLTGGAALRAGIKAGDRIIAVDSQSAKDVSLGALRTRLRTEPAGTHVNLRIKRAGSTHDVRLTLADMF